MLKVVGRRADGYHLLETVFRLIDLQDTIDIALRDDEGIELLNPLSSLPADSDLTVRAARLLQKVKRVKQGASLKVHKRIPIGGGLGGGSSDAATVLIALNQLWQLGLSRQELMELSLELGADVPFFIFGSNAYATGVGEELTALALPKAYYVILDPGITVSSTRVFSSFLLTPHSRARIIRTLEIPAMRENDLQNAVCMDYPEVAHALNRLKRFGEPLMTGSGGCVFLECPTQQQADQIYQRLSAQNLNALLAIGLDSHPLNAEQTFSF